MTETWYYAVKYACGRYTVEVVEVKREAEGEFSFVPCGYFRERKYFREDTAGREGVYRTFEGAKADIIQRLEQSMAFHARDIALLADHLAWARKLESPGQMFRSEEGRK